MRASAGLLLAILVAGCTSTPADYAASLSPRDAKWQTPECQEVRARAATFEERKLNLASGLLLGPYSMAIVAASREHAEKQRKLFAAEIHERCSSLPLPSRLKIEPPVERKTRAG